MKTLLLVPALLFSLFIQPTGADAALATGAEPWCNTLPYDGGNYWRVRVPIEIQNASKADLKGSHVRIRIASSGGTAVLEGEAVGRLRVADANATELLFDCETESGTQKHEGRVAVGDVMVVPVTVAGESNSRLYLYAGNPDAWPLPDMGDFAKMSVRSNRDIGSWLGKWGAPESAGDRVIIRVLRAERRALKVQGANAPWIAGPQWDYRVPLKIRNFEAVAPTDDLSRTGWYFIVNTRRIHNRIVKLLGFRAKPALRLVDPDDPERVKDISGTLSEHLVGDVFVAPGTEKVLWLYISANPNAKGRSLFVNLPYGHRDLGWSKTDTRAGDIEARLPQARPLVAWSANPLVKVFRDDLPPRNATSDVKIYAGRNSWRAFQVVVRSTAVRNVHIRVTPLRGPNGTELAAPNIYTAGYVPVDVPVMYTWPEPCPDYQRPVLPTAKMSLLYENSSLLSSYSGREGRPQVFTETDGWSNDWWPDPLVPVNAGADLRLEPGRAQPIWFDMHVPAGATPGLYLGEVEISDNQETVRLPVEMKVWRTVMPAERHLPALYELRINTTKGGSSEEAWFRFLARYNVSPCYASRVPKFSYDNARLRMETDEFDKIASLLIDELHIKKLYNPLGAYGARSRGYKSEDFGEAYRLFIDHVTKKGWRDNFVYYIVDEPGNVGERGSDVWSRTVRAADIAKQIAPDILIYVSTWHYYPVLEDHITLWGIGPEGSFPNSKLDERRQAGDRFWYTMDGQMCIDTPYLAVERLLPWFAHKYDVEAYEYWDIGYWTVNPWKYGWHPTKRRRLPNGDGYLAYPGEELGLSEPVPSIRLVAAREGVDDYEIFLQLKELAKAGSTEARQALERVETLVVTPNMGGAFSTDVMRDPNAVQAAWIEAGELLDQLVQLP